MSIQSLADSESRPRLRRTEHACYASAAEVIGMADDVNEMDDLYNRIEAGDEDAINEVFLLYRDRLKRMVRLRLDRRLQGRVDESDVLQEAFLDVSRRAKEYVKKPALPLFLWLRWLTGQRLLAIHRQHLGTQKRNAGQEISLHRGAIPHATSASLAGQLLGHLTSPTQAAMRAEMQIKLQEVLNSMDDLDREVLTLRHFEELSNNETAQVLRIDKHAASKRYMRALDRLRNTLDEIPGFFENA